ncbi:katanin p80 WD40 repeat-containing subunit B1 homolog KTN80.3-like isoform X2 [Tripterygium wilfordii]|uniref:katanin p80 WD40 repeat-containing subunit B1 homolog KTN80.3-like isoform X2 n=1 Tax=Tripterygium wilfordii TaxID=458696 RepID=UPI0018F7E574|nr:katanin p80 WD40 repeat-containing subunit B1 homolog KTN80.3-like isoform X2 [Tripterygium wilfordii]
MAKGGYKLQEFVAHSANVNCLSIGKKTCRLLITGGDDHKVNLWAIGKPTSLMSLCGHTSPVESLAFDTADVLVLAGASTGVIKLWDLEEAKMVRTLTGHRSNCTSVEFHPFGEFFASGSMDANLKIWDIRKKGCIHTYKGHTQGISNIRFTPDGRWVVSGGYDNVVKVWDLTAGKLLNDFKFHEGHIRSLDFHPLEFLLATGSADGTVKFWDLETFELIGSTRPEATGVCTTTFHPDGRTLFCGLEEGLKVYSWEPVICHDSVDMGWSTLVDLCIHDGKLLGCSYYQNSVGIWVADTSLIEPYGAGGFVPKLTDCTEQKCDLPGSLSLEKVGSCARLGFGLHCPAPDYETKEIKNIYVDSAIGNPVASPRTGSLSSPKVLFPLNSEESNLQTYNQDPAALVRASLNGQGHDKSFIVPGSVPRDTPDAKETSDSGRESITFSRTKPGMLLRPAHTRRPSTTKCDIDKASVPIEAGTLCNMKSEKEHSNGPNLQKHLLSEDGVGKSCGQKDSNIKNVVFNVENILSPQTPSNKSKRNESSECNNEINSVKIINGVAVVAGRTRSLVERFERRERLDSNGDETINITHQSQQKLNSNEGQETNTTKSQEKFKSDDGQATSTTQRPEKFYRDRDESSNTIPSQEKFNSNVDQATSTTQRREKVNSNGGQAPSTTQIQEKVNSNGGQATSTTQIKEKFNSNDDQATSTTQRREKFYNNGGQATSTTQIQEKFNSNEGQATSTMQRREKINSNGSQASNTTQIQDKFNSNGGPATNTMQRREKFSSYGGRATNVPPRLARYRRSEDQATIMNPHVAPEMDRASNPQTDEPRISGRDSTFANHRDITEDLMQTHDVFLSTLRSRMTKLQVVRHFWERNDIKGAISAMRKLPDTSVQADVISVLMEKMEILNLDLFSWLLPVLMSLLDSKIERHTKISMDMLLKLVAVFGPVIRSTMSAPPAVGIDLQAEQRRECCNQCFIQLQKIQKILPLLVSDAGQNCRRLDIVLAGRDP